MNSFTSSIAVDATEEDDLFEVIRSEYERVVVQSLVTSFGLDLFIKDQHGGDVDTIHNVRQIGTDPLMTYKNAKNQADYDDRGDYVSADYHGASAYKNKNAEISQARKNGTLQDAYTGEIVNPNAKIDLDHTVSAKETHEDRGRILAGLKGPDLANSSENLNPTNMSINRSKKQLSADGFIAKLKATQDERQAKIDTLKAMDTLTDAQRKELTKLESLQKADAERIQEADRKAREAIDRKINTAYYTSSKFARDLGLAAAKTGGKMALRQALGFVFTEIWFSVKEELDLVDDQFELSALFTAIGHGIRRGLEQAKAKYKVLFDTTLSGAVAGALSSVTTTLCNVFFTTAKNTVRIIRNAWPSLVDALQILFLNPDSLLLGERVRATAKVISVGGSVVAGLLVNEAISDTMVGAIPMAGDIIPAFCGTLVSGIISCTLLMYLDRCETVRLMVERLDNIPTVATDVQYFKQEAQRLVAYAAELVEIDLDTFQKELDSYRICTNQIQLSTSQDELQRLLENIIETIGIPIPWEGTFGSFMDDKSRHLVFE